VEGNTTFRFADPMLSSFSNDLLKKQGAFMSALRMFIPITKVDAARRLVYGLATAEMEDRAGEICDYASCQWRRQIVPNSGEKVYRSG
jgi:hypothetical protein